MTDTTLFNAGTADFTQGSATVVGHDTSWSALIAGDPIRAPDGLFYEITPVDDTHFTLNRNYLGTTVVGAVGGLDWFLFRSSLMRDSVRTATKQLTDITAAYRKVVKATNADTLLKTDRASENDRAGVVIQKAGVDIFQAGSFEDKNYAVRHLKDGTWRAAFTVDPDTGAFSIKNAFTLGSAISPSMLTATVNDYSPPGIDNAGVIRLTSNGTRTLTGLTGGQDGRLLTLQNVGTQNVALEDEAGTSSAINRFALPTNTTLVPKSSVLLVYDGTAKRWRALSAAGSGGSGGGSGPGEKGWSPVLAIVADGTRRVAQITDWQGGQGTAPSPGGYVGPTGLVSSIAEAIDIRGGQGREIQLQTDYTSYEVQWRYAGTLDWQTLVPLSAITGPIGPTTTIEWMFSTTTSDADPGDGKLRFNSNTFGSINQLYIDSKERWGTNVSSWINTFDDSDSLTHRGILMLIDVVDPSKFASFNVTGAVVDSGGYFKIPVTPVAGVIPADARRMSVLFIRTGDKGIPGIIPRGAFDIDHTYITGDVVNQDGSSYISLVDGNLGRPITFEGTNVNWALLARGVNDAFVTAINQTLAAATTQAQAAAASAAAALTSENLAANWANKTSANVNGTEFSAKEYAQGSQALTGGSAKNWSQQAGAISGAGVNDRSSRAWSQDSLIGATLGGSAKDWAITTTSTVNGVSFSSKEYAQGVQTGTGGSAKNWAQQLDGADVIGAAANSRSAKAWAQAVMTGATLGGSSKDWAITLGAAVDGASFSAKEYAQGSTIASGGSAKSWAQQTGSDVVGGAVGDRSAKSWAQDNILSLGGSAKDWATYIGGTVAGGYYSARYYAQSVQTAYTNVLTLEANTQAAAAAGASSATSAAASAVTAGQQAGIAATQAGISTTKADVATTQAGIAVTAKDATVVAKNDAIAAVAGIGTDKADTLAARDAAIAAAAAANTGALWNTRNIYLGRFSDPVTTIRNLGSFSS